MRQLGLSSASLLEDAHCGCAWFATGLHASSDRIDGECVIAAICETPVARRGWLWRARGKLQSAGLGCLSERGRVEDSGAGRDRYRAQAATPATPARIPREHESRCRAALHERPAPRQREAGRRTSATVDIGPLLPPLPRATCAVARLGPLGSPHGTQFDKRVWRRRSAPRVRRAGATSRGRVRPLVGRPLR